MKKIKINKPKQDKQFQEKYEPSMYCKKDSVKNALCEFDRILKIYKHDIGQNNYKRLMKEKKRIFGDFEK